MIAFLLAAAAVRLADPSPVARLRLLVFDTYQALSPRIYDASMPVRVLDIDEESLARIGQWPWPRAVMASLTRKLAENGAAAIGFDIVMAEPDRLRPAELAKWVAKDAATADILARLEEQLPSGDALLAEAFAAAPVIAGFIGNSEPGPAPVVRAGFAHAGDDPKQFIPTFRGAAQSLPKLQEKSRGSASLNWTPEYDTIVRRLPVLVRIGDQIYPSFAAEALRVAQGASTYVIKSSGASGEEAFGTQTGITAVRVGQLEVPTDAHGQMWLHFTKSDRRRFLSAVKVIEDEVPRSEIEGRIFLVGTSAAGLFDLRTTPLESAATGVEIHVQAIEQMMLGGHLLRPDFATGGEVVLLVIAGAIVAILVYATSALWSAFAGALMLATAVGSSWGAYRAFGWLLDPVYPAVTLTLLYVATTVYLYLRTEAERERVRNAFGHYMAPAMVEELAANPDKLKLGGEMRRVTIMFCDIRGFTTLSERLGAEQLTHFLNGLFTPLSDTIVANKGTIDKYIGDAIMAFWSAPLEDPQQERNACLAALSMLTENAELNEEWAREATASGTPPLKAGIGVGLNTAVCCVGNLGSEHRFDYSVIGDGVNIASRLEGQTKTYGVPIVVGEETVKGASDMAFLEIDFLSVMGRVGAIRVFALLGGAKRRSAPEFQTLLSRHDLMLAAYRSARFAEAAELLAPLRELGGRELTTLYDLYADRIGDYVREPPPPGWDGRTVADKK